MTADDRTFPLAATGLIRTAADLAAVRRDDIRPTRRTNGDTPLHDALAAKYGFDLVLLDEEPVAADPDLALGA
jgi:hypothetical protein